MLLVHEGTWRVPGLLCPMQVVSVKGTRGEGDQEEASRTSPGAPSTAREAWTRLCCHSEYVGDSGAQVPAFRMLGKHCLCQKPRRLGSQSRHRILEYLSGLHGPPREPWGEAHPRAPYCACVSRPSRRPPAQPRSRPVAVATGSRGEGPRRGGCYFCRFLFLAATSPWQRSSSARPPLGSAGARDPGRSRPLVPLPHPPRCPRPAGRQIDGRRLLKHSGSVSVFMTLTRQRYLLLLFAPAARELTFGKAVPGRRVAPRGPPSFRAPSPRDRRGEGPPRPGGSCLKEKKATKINKRGADDFILGKANFLGTLVETAPEPLTALSTKPDGARKSSALPERVTPG